MINQTGVYIANNEDVSDAIVKLLGLTGIRIKNDPLPIEKEWPKAKLWLESRSVEGVVQATQGKLDPSLTWLGDLTKERWEENQGIMALSKAQAKEMINICVKDLQQGESIDPFGKPKAVLFLGSDLFDCRLRLAYLNKLIEEGKISSSLPMCILTGERKLDREAGETEGELMNLQNGIISFREDWKGLETVAPSDEGEMVKLIFSQSRHMRIAEKDVHYIYAQKGSKKRATTASTVEEWLKTSPEGGLYIAVSNQPYVFYQECVIRRVLLQNKRNDIIVEVIGPQLEKSKLESSQQLIQDLLSNTSRILYELFTIDKLKKGMVGYFNL